MLLTGIILKNLPGLEFEDTWPDYASTLRGTALVIILMRAGLGLDPQALKENSGKVVTCISCFLTSTQCLVSGQSKNVTKIISHQPCGLAGMVFRLAFTPCLVETLVVAVASHLLLNFPWLWGFMLGFVLAAVSPAVVVPCLLQLQGTSSVVCQFSVHLSAISQSPMCYSVCTNWTAGL